MSNFSAAMPGLSRWWIVAGACGALAVALGAFGAHGLESLAASWPEVSRGERLANWETASRYHMYHALALFGVATLATLRPGKLCHLAGSSFVAGILIFSGGLYAYVLTEIKLLVHVVPIGGLLLIAGWCLLAMASVKR